jgi:hypothetical protein
MRDPFAMASRRIIRRLGKPITFLKPDGEPIKIKGVYAGPEEDVIVKGKKGGLVLKNFSATLCVSDLEHSELSKEWKIIIPHLGKSFFAADHDDDGDGCTVIFLSDDLSETAIFEDQNNVSKWR